MPRKFLWLSQHFKPVKMSAVDSLNQVRLSFGWLMKETHCCEQYLGRVNETDNQFSRKAAHCLDSTHCQSRTGRPAGTSGHVLPAPVMGPKVEGDPSSPVQARLLEHKP